MRNTKAIGSFTVSKVVRPKGQKLFRQRTTNQYNAKGTMSSNQGYLRVEHDPKTGKFKSLDVA